MTRTVKTEVRVLRKGAVVTTLKSAPDTNPVIRCDDSGPIKTSLSGSFRRAPEVDWLNDELQPVLTIDGVEHPVGVFLPATVEEYAENGAEYLTVEAYDRCWRLQTTTYPGWMQIPTSNTYLYRVKLLLTGAGVKLVLAPPDTTPSFAYERLFEIGTDYLSVVNTLLSEINFDDLFFTAEGTAVLRPYQEPGAANLTKTLDASNVKSLVLPTLRKRQDVYSAPNVFVVTCATPDKSSIMTATATNDNPQSPLSVSRRGRKIYRLVQLDDVANQAALTAYANRLCSESMLTGESVTVQTALLPGYGYREIVGLHYGDLSGIFLEHGWSMDFGVGGTMTHNLERLVTTLA